MAACNPLTTRPDFFPLPQAPVVRVNAPRDRVVTALSGFVADEGLRVRQQSGLDGYLETDWYDTKNRKSVRSSDGVSDLWNTVKIRCWVDPYVPGESIVTIEATFRPRYDPSRLERDLEMLAPPGHDGAALVERVLKELRKRFGSADSTKS